MKIFIFDCWIPYGQDQIVVIAVSEEEARTFLPALQERSWQLIAQKDIAPGVVERFWHSA